MRSVLQFWEDAQHVKKVMTNNVAKANQVVQTYVDDLDTALFCFDDTHKDELRQQVLWQPLTIESFDQSIRLVEDILRDECFEAFIEDHEAFEKFKQSETELGKCIIFEHDYAQALKQRKPHHGGCHSAHKMKRTHSTF